MSFGLASASVFPRPTVRLCLGQLVTSSMAPVKSNVIVYRERKAFFDVMRLSGRGSRDGTRGRFRGRYIAQR